MSVSIIEKKKQIEQMQLEMNVLKLETRMLEIEEEKIHITENIAVQKERLKTLKSGKKEDE